MSDLLGHGPIAWPKKPREWRDAVRDVPVIYEDEHVVAFVDPEDAPHESPREPGEMRVTVLAKRLVASLMDLTVADEALNARMLHAIQQVAYRLDLQEKGFEVFAHVLPPHQHRPGLAFKIRVGRRPKHSAEASNAPPTAEAGAVSSAPRE